MIEPEIISINIKDTKESGLSLNEIMCLFKVAYPTLNYDGLFQDYEKLEYKKFIKIVNNDNKVTYILRKKAELFLNKTKQIDKKIELSEEQLKLYRDKWGSLNLNRGLMGSKVSCKEKLIRWMNENPEYNFEDILKAVDKYLSTFSCFQYKYLQRADYFIFKKEGKEESSRLSAFIEELNNEYPDEDWTTNIK